MVGSDCLMEWWGQMPLIWICCRLRDVPLNWLNQRLMRIFFCIISPQHPRGYCVEENLMCGKFLPLLARGTDWNVDAYSFVCHCVQLCNTRMYLNALSKSVFFPKILTIVMPDGVGCSPINDCTLQRLHTQSCPQHERTRIQQTAQTRNYKNGFRWKKPFPCDECPQMTAIYYSMLSQTINEVFDYSE